MMTTETATPRRRLMSDGVLVGCLACAASGVVTTLVGAVVGPTALVGALVGAMLALALLAFGSISLDLVSRAVPGAALVVAVVTYSVQVCALLLVLSTISGPGEVDGVLDPTWVAVGLAAGTASWVVAQVVAVSRRRIPVYDIELPEQCADDAGPVGRNAPEAGAR